MKPPKQPKQPAVYIAVICDLDGYIGENGTMPWHLPADLKYFRQLTWGSPIIMGRCTHESIGRPLPGRRNIVLSRRPDYRAEGCDIVDSFAAAMETARADNPKQIFVTGGRIVYEQAIPLTERIYMTRVQARQTGKLRFPPLEPGQWREEIVEKHPADARNPYDLIFTVLERADAGTRK